jgi:hypothetical protein
MTTSLPIVIRELRQELHGRLDRKTSWGRNEVMSAFDQSVTEVLLRLVSQPGAAQALDTEEEQRGDDSTSAKRS